MRAPHKPGFLTTLRAALNVAGAIEGRRKPSESDLAVLGIDRTFAGHTYFRPSGR